MRHGHRVGHTGVVCTITSVDHEESQCVGTAWFRGGQITIQGLLWGEPETFVFPVTGGSGAFEGAEGVLHVRELSDTKGTAHFPPQQVTAAFDARLGEPGDMDPRVAGCLASDSRKAL